MKRGWSLTVLVGAFLFYFHGSVAADYYDGLRAFDQGDHETAVHEWVAAARLGDTQASFRMGKLHEQGVGVPQNFIRGHAYYNLAAAKGHAEALKARDAIAAKMTRAELADARRLAADWALATEGMTPRPPPTGQKQHQSSATAQSVDRFNGLWKWSLVAELSCDVAFGPPVKIIGGSFKGIVSSMQDSGLSILYGNVDATGKLTAFAAGDYVSVNVIGQLSGDQGEGSTDVTGEKSCTEYWKATRIKGH